MNKTVSIRTLIFYAVLIGFILFFVDSCKRNFAGGLFRGAKTDTISVVHDTAYVMIQGDTTYVPQIHTITQTNTIYKPLYRTDTLEISEVLPTDTAAILARFYQKLYYSDTVFRGDTGKRVSGYIVVNDSIHQNRITSRRLVTDLKFPEVTTTVTIQKNKFVLYMGATVTGTPGTPVYAIGGDVAIKSVNGKMYSVGASSTKAGDVYYTVGMRVPVRLRKK